MTTQTVIPHQPWRHIHHPGAPILSIKDLSVQYEAGHALEDISFEVISGERMAVVGPNGAGKSTLFKAIAGLLRPDRGSVSVFGVEPRSHICIAYLPQRNQVDWNFPVTVADVVMMGRTRKIGFLRWPAKSDKEIVNRSLQIVGMTSLSQRQISQLSGGQQQRMFIARALAQEADLLLMDEPVTGLDTPSQEELFKVLDSLKKSGVTVLLALHDLKLAATSFDRVLLLNHRLIGLGSPANALSEENLKQAYGDRIQVLAHEQDIAVLDDSCCGEEDHTHA